MDAEKWVLKLISINWTFILKIWQLRDEEEHGTDAISIERKKKGKLLVEIFHLQETCNGVEVKDRELLVQDLKVLKTYIVVQHKNWLHGAKILEQIQ